MRVKVVSSEELVQELEKLVEQQRNDKYSLQVGLRDVEFALDEEKASGLEVAPEMGSIDKAELYLRQGVLTPVKFVENDGTVHQVIKWDPAPVGYSGFMDCVTHSSVVTDQGTFEVGRYPAVQLQDPAKVWQWFIHRKIEENGQG